MVGGVRDLGAERHRARRLRVRDHGLDAVADAIAVDAHVFADHAPNHLTNNMGVGAGRRCRRSSRRRWGGRAMTMIK